MDLNKACVFIPVSDVEEFEDYDKNVGYGIDCVYLDEGIVVRAEREQFVKEQVEKFEKFQDEMNEI